MKATRRKPIKEVKRLWIVGQYFDSAGTIDIHNHLSLSLETALRTHRWDVRLYSTVLGMTVVDAYLAQSFSEPGDSKHKSITPFHEALAISLLNTRLA